MKTTCHICGKEFTPGPRDYQHASGWIQPLRKQGGANALSHPKRDNQWTHNECLKFPGQMQL